LHIKPFTIGKIWWRIFCNSA